MSNIRLVTGYAGEAHITSADAGALYAAIAGPGQYVMATGNRMAASIVTNNQVRLLDGDLLMQGRHARIEPGAIVDLTIDSGASGYNRNDLIVARYTKDSSSGVESMALVVIKGTPSTGAAADPAYISGDLINGNASQNDMPLYRITLNGLNAQAPVQLFTVLDGFGSHATNKENPHSVTPDQIGAAKADHTHSPAAIGAAAADHAHTLDSLTNVHICDTEPDTLVEGHWYLIKDQ